MAWGIVGVGLMVTQGAVPEQLAEVLGESHRGGQGAMSTSATTSSTSTSSASPSSPSSSFPAASFSPSLAPCCSCFGRHGGHALRCWKAASERSPYLFNLVIQEFRTKCVALISSGLRKIEYEVLLERQNRRKGELAAFHCPGSQTPKQAITSLTHSHVKQA